MTTTQTPIDTSKMRISKPYVIKGNNREVFLKYKEGWVQVFSVERGGVASVSIKENYMRHYKGELETPLNQSKAIERIVVTLERSPWIAKD